MTAAGLIGFLAFLGVVRCLRSSSPESGVIATATGRGGSGSNSSNGNGSGSRGIRSTGLALSASLLPEDDRTPLNNAGSPYFVPVSISYLCASSSDTCRRQVGLIRQGRGGVLQIS